MCKNYRVQRNVIELAKKDTPEVYAVFEDGPVPDLVGIVKVYERTHAALFDVYRYGDTELFRTIPMWARPSNRAIARMFDLTTSYRVVPC